MSAPLPPWRIVGEEGRALIIGVDMPDLTQAQIAVLERQFGTPEMDAMIRRALADWERTRSIVDTPGGS